MIADKPVLKVAGYGRRLELAVVRLRRYIFRRGASPVRGKRTTMRIVEGDLSDPRVIALLEVHLINARAQTAPGSAHALGLEELRSPGIQFWTVWHGHTLLAMGALKRLSIDHGELKSIHTAQTARRRGVGGMMVRHIITAARASGLSRLSLETGSWDYFQPARALFRRHGFIECPPFGAYVADANSVFMTLDLGNL